MKMNSENINLHEELNIMGCKIPTILFSPESVEYLERFSFKTLSVEELWNEIDNVWDSLGIKYDLPLSNQPISEFYSHPVWVLNGIFSSSDVLSSKHRNYIVDKVIELKPNIIADYGGGSGELAIRLATKIPNAIIHIVEPYASEYLKYRISSFENISIVSSLDNLYDIIVAQDVLEHLEDPLNTVIKLSDSVPVGGNIIFANCFDSVIKCHLPSTFHLRYSFKWIVSSAGLKFIQQLPFATHVEVYKKVKAPNVFMIRNKEVISKIFEAVIKLFR